MLAIVVTDLKRNLVANAKFIFSAYEQLVTLQLALVVGILVWYAVPSSNRPKANVLVASSAG